MSSETVRLSVADAAQHLGVSVDTVRRRIRANEIDAQRDNTGKWWVMVSAAGEAPARQPSAVPPPSRGDGELLDHLLVENERLWESLTGKDALIRDLVDRLAEATKATAEVELTRSERDNARDQLRELKRLVAQMLRRMERSGDVADDVDPLSPDELDHIRDSLIA